MIVQNKVGIPGFLSKIALLGVLFACGASLLEFFYFRQIASYSIYFVVISSILGVSKVFFALLSRERIVLDRFDLSVAALISLICLSLLYHFAFGVDRVGVDGRSSLSFSINAVLVSFVWLLAGVGVSGVVVHRSNFYALVILSIYAALVVPVLGESFIVNYYRLRTDYGIEALNHTYISYVSIFLMSLAFVLADTRMRPIIGAACMIGVFVLGSRSDFLIFSLFISLYISRWLFVSVIILGVGVLAGAASWFGESFDGHRMLISSGVVNDDSVEARISIFVHAIADLPNQFLFGDATHIVERNGHIGLYAHNILSYWQFFGFFAFSAAVYISYKISSFSFEKFFSRRTDVVNDWCSFLTGFSVLSILLSKFFAYPIFWFVIGVWFWGRHASRSPSTFGEEI